MSHSGRSVHLYVVGRHELICASDVAVADSVAGVEQEPPAPASSSITLGSVFGGDRRGHMATVEYGRAGADVRRISFVFSRGGHVVGSVGGGWLLVWWPSGQSPTAAELTTASGTRTVRLGAEAASPAVSCGRECFSESSQGRVVGTVRHIGSGAAGFSGTILSGGSSVSQGNPDGPGPPSATIGARSSSGTSKSS